MDLDDFEEPEDDEDEDHVAPYGANVVARPTQLAPGEISAPRMNAPQVAAGSRRTELDEMIATSGLEGKDAAYLRILDTLIRRAGRPTGESAEADEGDPLEPGNPNDMSQGRGMKAFTDLDQIRYEIMHRARFLTSEFEEEERKLI